jgi:hypothetical protein
VLLAENFVQTAREPVSISRLAFPDDRNFPSSFTQCFLDRLIANDVGFELGLPECSSCFGNVREAAAPVRMKKAPVNEDYTSVLSKDDIRRPW